ncbi:hypothetical protein BGZ60DRAFT_365646 [Tricladium varicosporioides]|nr:hypothetical protein BGZ60DRAFT_365646 [Hymenoscyphus varicosporioides]
MSTQGYIDSYPIAGSLQGLALDSPSHAYAEYLPSRPTPEILGWEGILKVDEYYNFLVPKGKEPCLELKKGFPESPFTPRTVFLHREDTEIKNYHPCQYPGSRCWKPNIGRPVFGRPADLERHYRQVHAADDQKECWRCDRQNCNRDKEPFTRKDHFRDHLKDFHKEDIGYCKGEKTATSSAEKKKWAAKQKIWEAERVISVQWWRCAKCLRRVYITEQGWHCKACKRDCELPRREAREAKRQYSDTKVQASSSYSSNARPTLQSTCSTCNGNEYWEKCYECQPSTESSQYNYNTWDNSQWNRDIDEVL